MSSNTAKSQAQTVSTEMERIPLMSGKNECNCRKQDQVYRERVRKYEGREKEDSEGIRKRTNSISGNSYRERERERRRERIEELKRQIEWKNRKIEELKRQIEWQFRRFDRIAGEGNCMENSFSFIKEVPIFKGVYKFVKNLFRN